MLHDWPSCCLLPLGERLFGHCPQWVDRHPPPAISQFDQPPPGHKGCVSRHAELSKA